MCSDWPCNFTCDYTECWSSSATQAASQLIMGGRRFELGPFFNCSYNFTHGCIDASIASREHFARNSAESSKEVEALVCFHGSSFVMVGAGYIVYDIYASEPEAFGHLHISTFDADWEIYTTMFLESVTSIFILLALWERLFS